VLTDEVLILTQLMKNATGQVTRGGKGQKLFLTLSQDSGAGGYVQKEYSGLYRYPFSAQMRNLPLHAGTYVREGKAKLLRTAPANCCPFDGEGVDFVLREDTALQLCSNGNFNGTCDATAPNGKISKLSFTGHYSGFRCKLAAQSDCDAGVLTFVRLLSANRNCMAG